MADAPTRDDEVDTGSEGPPTGDPLPRAILELDHVYGALGHPRRRYVCYTLLEDTQWTLTDLATKVAAWENEVPERAVTSDQRERVYVSLYHAHVPKLADERVVAFDDVTEIVTPAENADQILAALDGMGASLDSTQKTHARGEMDDEER